MFSFQFTVFSERLKDLRISRGINMSQLSKCIETSRGAIANLEHGNRKPSLELLIRIADFFDVSIDYLVGRTDNPKLH